MRQILIEKYVEPSNASSYRNFFHERWFNEDGELHSILGQPADIFYENGQIVQKEWYKKGVKHRGKRLPAEVWYENERIFIEYWYKNGEKTKEV
jgi:hypothetical protein